MTHQATGHVSGHAFVDRLRPVQLRGASGDPELDPVGDAAGIRRRGRKNLDLPDQLSSPEVPVRHRQLVPLSEHSGELKVLRLASHPPALGLIYSVPKKFSEEK